MEETWSRFEIMFSFQKKNHYSARKLSWQNRANKLEWSIDKKEGKYTNVKRGKSSLIAIATHITQLNRRAGNVSNSFLTTKQILVIGFPSGFNLLK